MPDPWRWNYNNAELSAGFRMNDLKKLITKLRFVLGETLIVHEMDIVHTQLANHLREMTKVLGKRGE
jgi:hypothetical protein